MESHSLHIPVMLSQVVAALAPSDGHHILDATFGNGGYSQALLDSADCHVTAFDRDPDAIQRGTPLVDAYAGKLTLIETPFSEMGRYFNSQSQLDGIVFDLGVCSTQLDQADRGFSFRQDGPLDMRMSKEGRDAADIINDLSEAELADILWRYGDERASRRIARAIVRARLDTRIERTSQLADIIHSVMPRPKPGQTDSATRSFQALRIFVNDELEQLYSALHAAEAALRPGGVLAVVSFHSLEDRMVKQFLADRSGRIANPSRHRPTVGDAPIPSFELTPRKPIAPDEAELQANPRARSARLRVALRTEAPAHAALPRGGRS